MSFRVPQFIEVEDKIVGPLTFKQFVYLGGGGGLAFILYAYLPLYLAIIPIFAVIIFAFSLAFVKVHNRPMIIVIEAALKYLASSKLYLWKHRPQPPTPEKAPSGEQKGAEIVPAISHSRLDDLSWSLDVKEKIQ